MRQFPLVVGLVGTIAALLVGVAACAPFTSPAPSAAATPSGTPAQTSSPSPGPSPSPPSPSPSPTAPTGPIGDLPVGAVPVIYLHRVEAVPPDWATWTAAQQKDFIDYDLLPAAFLAQLDWLKANGYVMILPKDLADHWDAGTPLPSRPVIITFDDGYPSWYDLIFPALKARGMVAEFYVTGARVADGSVTWAELEEMLAAGNGIGGHDVHHTQLTNVGGSRAPASSATMWAEITGIRTLIHDNLGVWPDSMAYVGGGYDATLIALVKKAGYRTARTTHEGFALEADERYTLPAIHVSHWFDVVDPVTEELVPGLPRFVSRMTVYH